MRIIIDNRAGVPDEEALGYAISVARRDSISGNNLHQAWATVFTNGVVVLAHKNKTGHKFVVYREEPQNAE